MKVAGWAEAHYIDLMPHIYIYRSVDADFRLQ
jgi:hypothetical protein